MIPHRVGVPEGWWCGSIGWFCPPGFFWNSGKCILERQATVSPSQAESSTLKNVSYSRSQRTSLSNCVEMMSRGQRFPRLQSHCRSPQRDSGAVTLPSCRAQLIACVRFQAASIPGRHVEDMLQIADGKSGHPAVVIGLPRAAGQIVYCPGRPVEVNLVNLSTWCVVDVVLVVGRGGEGDDPAILGVGGSADARGQVPVDPLP